VPEAIRAVHNVWVLKSVARLQAIALMLVLTQRSKNLEAHAQSSG